MKKTIIYILFLYPVVSMLFGQNAPEPVNIQSPNVAGLGKYGDVPVSYFTGTPSINIPLKQLNIDGIPLDISLSHDASGVRVNSLSSWVGQNWSLNAGGMIMRSISGWADEHTHINQVNNGFTCNWFNTAYLPININVNNPQELMGLTNLQTAGSVSGGDCQPDIFIFNFMGKSGKFYFGNDGQWKVQCDENIEVIFDFANDIKPPFFENYYQSSDKYQNVIYGFTLKDENGYAYEFGRDQTAIEYSINFFGQNSSTVLGSFKPQWSSNAWYLKNVTNPYGQTVYTFEYQRGYFIADLQYSDFDKYMYQEQSPSFAFPGNTVYNGGAGNAFNDINGCLISPVYLNKIKVSDGTTVTFYSGNANNFYIDKANDIQLKRDNIYRSLSYPNANVLCYLEDKNLFRPYSYDGSSSNPIKGLMWRRLNEIEISKNKREFFRFRYDKNITNRLKLMEITKADTLSTVSSAQTYSLYKFEYNNFESLPGPLSKSIDHWGYYKGSDYPNLQNKLKNEGLFNLDVINSYYKDRNPQAYYLGMGTLTKIRYPSGGYTSLLYEPNGYAKIVSDNRQSLITESGTGPGVRVKQINDCDGTKTKTRIFTYSGGILTFKPQYYSVEKAYVANDEGKYESRSFSSNSIVPLSNLFGYTIGYSKVTETETGNGRTEYYFTGYDQFKDYPPLATLNNEYNPYIKSYSDISFMLGKLKKKIVYGQNGKAVHATTYTYRSDVDVDCNYIQASNISFRQFYESGLRFYFGNVYRIYYSNYDMVTERTADYFQNDSVVTETSYTKIDTLLTVNPSYTPHKVNIRYLKKVTATTSTGSYSFNYLYSFNEPNNSVFKTGLTDKFRIGTPVLVKKIHNGQDAGVNKTTYKKIGALTVPSEEFTSESDESKLVSRIKYDTYNSAGKLTSYTVNNLRNAIIWGYNNTLPLGIAVNESYDHIALKIVGGMATLNRMSSAITPYDSDLNLLENVKELLPQAAITTYKYDLPFGMSVKKEPDGTASYFDYDVFGRLAKVRDSNSKTISEYVYNYTAPPPLEVSLFKNKESAMLGDELIFNASIDGKSNDYDISWILKDRSSNILSQASNTLVFNTRALKSDVLYGVCTVTDRITGDNMTVQTGLYTSNVLCKFTNIRSNSYSMDADLIVPLEDVVVFSMSRMGTEASGQGIVTIGNRSFSLQPYEMNKTVEIPAGHRSVIPCRVETNNGGTVRLHIERLKNGTTTVDTSNSTLSK